MKSCDCGCGELIPLINKRGEIARFKHGHNSRVDPPFKEQNIVGYRAMHQRIERRYGKATNFECSLCGDRASLWGLNHECDFENLRVDIHTKMYGLVFSIHPEDYRPICKSCNNLEGWPSVDGTASKLLSLGRTSI